MRLGTVTLAQNYGDWDRFEAEERGDEVAPGPAISDRSIFLEEVALAQAAEGLGFDACGPSSTTSPRTRWSPTPCSC